MVKHASLLSVEQLKGMMELDSHQPQDYQDMCFLAMTVFAGMRVEDVDGLLAIGVTKVPYHAGRNEPRM